MTTANLQSPWLDNDLFKNPSQYNPYDNPIENYRVQDDCWVSGMSRMPTKAYKKIETIDGQVLSLYNGVDLKVSNPRQHLINMNNDLRFDAYANRSRFYNNYNDGEISERFNYGTLEEFNPEEEYDQENVQEAQNIVENVNSIAKPVMTDTGVAKYDYEFENEDNVKMVQNANMNYYRAENKYWQSQPSKPDVDIDSMLKNLETQQNFKPFKQI